jgi:predicted nucleic acid-binding protein
MTIYPDTSFLISWLYSADANNRKARAWFVRYQKDEWLLSDWSRFETLNALRSLCLVTKGPKQQLVEALRRYFNHLLRCGPFEQGRVDWQEVIKDANQISSAFASRTKTRSADTLHIAILEQLSPDLFVTGNKDQAILATARGFSTALFL